jgi:beta-barrel assembly-enhancing protease
MRLNRRAIVAILLCESLILSTLGCGGARHAVAPQVPLAPVVFRPLQEALQKSYLELFELAPTLEFSQAQIEQMRKYLDEAEKYCVTQFKERSNQYEKQLQQTQAELRQETARLEESRRHDLHCRIQNLRALKSQTEVLANQAIPVAYENRRAKLELIEKWPDQFREIKQEIASGAYHNRKWGDVQDIGFREIARGQEDDVKDGQEAIKQLKQAGMLPPEVEDKAVKEYVSTLAERIAKRSDLRVPVKVTVLNSKEINAFALPGGFLFVQRGLLEAVEDESQLVGVMAHESGHVVARHSHRLMTRATISQVIYQAAQVAALILTGGAAGIGTYYALQYGFYGLGLVLNLNLLGVSREFELEADQLGVQYAWNSGYDPNGFIRFFDKMASREGYVNGASWFRTHPPFYERMVKAEREIMFLPKKSNLLRQTSEFEGMKRELAKVTKAAEQEEKGGPSLLAPEQGCPPPQKIEYKPDQPIETICSSPTKQGSH